MTTCSRFLSGKFHGHRSLEGYSPWGRKVLDTTEHACMQSGWGDVVYGDGAKVTTMS